jgi:uncharacterized tellurite resistance protein B-like protein
MADLPLGTAAHATCADTATARQGDGLETEWEARVEQIRPLNYDDPAQGAAAAAAAIEQARREGHDDAECQLVRLLGFSHLFMSLTNRHFSQPQKERVIELMWQVTYADDARSAHELHLMRKIAGLLHVPDSA